MWHKWYDAGIIRIKDILKDNNYFMDTKEIEEKYNIKHIFYL